MTKYTIELTDSEVVTAQRLCDSGIGTTISDTENLNIIELISWRIKSYIRNKSSMYLDVDRSSITKEELDSIVTERIKNLDIK